MCAETSGLQGATDGRQINTPCSGAEAPRGLKPTLHCVSTIDRQDDEKCRLSATPNDMRRDEVGTNPCQESESRHVSVRLASGDSFAAIPERVFHINDLQPTADLTTQRVSIWLVKCHNQPQQT
jgi:hypothetical protein